MSDYMISLLDTMYIVWQNPFFFTASIFAYGQTSSGKTYTMSGLTEYTVADIYDYIPRVMKSIELILISFQLLLTQACYL